MAHARISNEPPVFVLVSPKNRTAYNFRGELIQDVAQRGYDVLVTGPNEEGVERIEARGARFRKVPLNKTSLSVVGDMLYLLRLWRMFMQEKPRNVLAYTVKPVVYGALAAKLAGVPRIAVMITGAGYAFTATSLKARVVRLLVSLLYRAALACADVVIFQNPDDRQEFLDRGLVAESKARLVNGSGVDVDRFDEALFPDRVTFFMLARILRSKGVREYLEAARIVKSSNPQARFVLLGGIESMPDALTLQDINPFVDDGTIEYFGETTDVAPYYKECSVYVLPSYREGTPRTVLEAMATGRPILTTDVPGCRHTVDHGVTGFLIPPRDVNALVGRMEWFITNPGRIMEMGRASRRLCLEKFDVRTVNLTMQDHLGLSDQPNKFSEGFDQE